MSTRLVGTLRGDGAAFGIVTANDLAKLLTATEQAVARAAGHVSGKPIRGTGRRSKAIVASTRLVVEALHEGSSIVAAFRPPDTPLPPGGFAFDVESLGEASLSAMLDTAAGDDETRTDVASALSDLLETLDIGGRYTEYEMAIESDHMPARRVVLGQGDRQRLAYVAAGPENLTRLDRLPSVMVAVDFEQHHGRARDSVGGVVAVEFDPSLDDEVQQSMRTPVDLIGDVSVDSMTGAPRSIRVTEVNRQTSLWGPEAMHGFWDNSPLERLLSSLGSLPATDIDAMGMDISDEEYEGFFGTATNDA